MVEGGECWVVCCCFFFEGYGDHRDLHRVDRRQRQMCIRDRSILIGDGFRNGMGVVRPFYAAFLALLHAIAGNNYCLLYTSPSPRDRTRSRMPSSA